VAVRVGFESAEMWRSSDMEEYVGFIQCLPRSDRLEPRRVLGGFPSLTAEDAVRFVTNWLEQRPSRQTGTILLDLFWGLASHWVEDVAVAVYANSSSGHFLVEGDLKSLYRIHGEACTIHWETAYHASHVGALYATLENGRLETGPRTKNDKRKQPQRGVFCHKHGTRRKCSCYLLYFQFDGFLAAPLYELRVCPYSRRTCGDQWCCPPDKVQITRVWFHIVSNASAIPGQLWIAPAWEQTFEFRQPS
jgi:hypothetical protein